VRRLLRWMGGKDGGGAQAAEAVEPFLPVEQVGEFLRHFPVGARVYYYAEFQKATKFDTIVLGYDVNGENFFSHQALRVRRSGGTARLFAHTPDGPAEVPRVDRFHFIVPHQLRSELDYAPPGGDEASGEMTEKVVNDFKRGNTITLVNKGGQGRLPHIDTVVSRVLDLRNGVFANRRVVLLEPDPGSFEFLDQRHFHRVYTSIPAVLAEEMDGERHRCTILDFSERFVRLGLESDSLLRGRVREGSRLLLLVEFRHRNQRVLLRGMTHRVTAEGMVLGLQSVYKNKRFQNLDLIEELDLKASLLHHPSTVRALHGEGELPA